MSVPPSIDAYDAQMLDFSSDPDVPMNITASAEFFAEALMDHDGHLDVSSYAEHASVEVDMEEYIGDNAEYEMADETAEYQRAHGDELLDIEVYDASHAPSPLVPLQPLQPSVSAPIHPEHVESTSPSFSEPAILALPSEPEVEVHPTPLEPPVADTLHVEHTVVSSDTITSESAHPTDDTPAESAVATSESREHLDDAPHGDKQVLETPGPEDVDEAEPHIPPVVEEHPVGLAQHENSEPPTAESAPSGDAYEDGSSAQVEKAVDQAPVVELEAGDPLRISEGVYIDPPPAVLLAVSDLSGPGFALFNQPETAGNYAEDNHGDEKVYSLLLENRPTLYYEPLSAVFEALRQDEGLLSCVPNSFEGELVLDAYDLQLVVSEDNIHSREISLHDLNILHDGSDFAGPLRLLLRAIVPRFIIRFYALQEQIQRLTVAAETGEGDHGEEHREHYDTGEEQPQFQGEEGVSHHSVHVSEGSEVLPATETSERSVKEPLTHPGPSEGVQVNYEEEQTTVVEEPAAEYHEVTGQATRALEDENDYEGTNVGDDDETTESESLDADLIHEVAGEDTDALAVAPEQGPEFGGEQTEYLDYVQPEEYDERYGEDLPERAGGASPVQYGEPPHYEEEGEQDTSTAVDETQVALPGSDEDEEDKSTATPIPAHVVLEPVSAEFANDGTLDEPTSAKPDNSETSNEEFVPSESTNEAYEKASGKQESSAKIFSEVEESDSNFVSMLEREADAEFDRTFNPEQSLQENSVEANLQHDEAWDEWDDELDAEGEDEEDWIDPDAASNESSVTLSSKASSKRSYDEMDPSEELDLENLENSPGSKRSRVQ